MIAEIGNFSIVIALLLSVLLAIYPMWGAQTNHKMMISSAKPLAIGLFTFTLIAYICLTNRFLADDFSVSYVANHSNSLLPRQQTI